jgi:hypothetical protein
MDDDAACLPLANWSGSASCVSGCWRGPATLVRATSVYSITVLIVAKYLQKASGIFHSVVPVLYLVGLPNLQRTSSPPSTGQTAHLRRDVCTLPGAIDFL